MSINPILMSSGASFISLSPTFISQSFIELLERFGFLARCPEFMMYFHACSVWTVALTIFLAFLLFPVLPYLLLAPFIFVRKFIYIVSVCHVDFPNSPLPISLSFFQGSELSLHISLNFVGSFISLFISIGSFLFVCFCEF